MTCTYKYLVTTLIVGMAAHAAFADDSSDSVYRSTTNAPSYSRPYLERTTLLTAEIIGGQSKLTANAGSSSGSNSGTLNRVDYGASAGARVELPFSPSVALNLDAKYFFGLANLVNKDKVAASTGISPDSLDISSHTRDMQVGAGLAIAL